MSAQRRYRSVPLQRRWMNDIVHFGKKSHIMGCAWQIDVAPWSPRAAQQQQQPVIGWTAMWLKALALVSQRRPELRTLYLPFPWARLYVRPETVGTIVIERTWQGVSALFFEQFSAPEKRSLLELDDALRKLKQAPVKSVGSFRRLIRISRLPVVGSRLIWSFGLNWSGPRGRNTWGSARSIRFRPVAASPNRRCRRPSCCITASSGRTATRKFKPSTIIASWTASSSTGSCAISRRQ
jgi:hypothetical protein